MKIAFLIPEFPGQTHAFFWREMGYIERVNGGVEIISTRKPRITVEHEFTEAAMRRTSYLKAIAIRSPFKTCGFALYAAFKAIRKESQFGYEAVPEGFLKRIVLVTFGIILKDYCERNKIDHIHGHSCGDVGYIASICRRLGGPNYSLTLHGDLDVYGRGHFYKFSPAKFIGCVTQALVSQVKSYLPELQVKVILIRMGIDVQSFHSIRTSADDRFRIVTVARLNKQKGHQYVLIAIKSLVDSGKKIFYDIVGTGDYLDDLKKIVYEFQLQNYVNFVGSMENSKILNNLQNYDAFVLPSVGLGEAAPVAVMEAMGAGVPVICSIIGGTPELIEDGVDGFLVPQARPDLIAGCLNDLMNNFDIRERISIAARRKAAFEFSYDIQARKLLNEISE